MALTIGLFVCVYMALKMVWLYINFSMMASGLVWTQLCYRFRIKNEYWHGKSSSIRSILLSEIDVEVIIVIVLQLFDAIHFDAFAVHDKHDFMLVFGEYSSFTNEYIHF